MKKILLIGIAGLLMVGCGKKEPTEAELNSFRELKAQESVKALLKDPSSAEFRNMNGMCGEVNSKNSFGVILGLFDLLAHLISLQLKVKTHKWIKLHLMKFGKRCVND